MNDRITRPLFVGDINRVASKNTIVVTSLYIATIAGAEAIGAFIGNIPSILCHAILLPILLGHYALSDNAPYRRILPALALAPLLRILSISLPIKQVPWIYWTVISGIPLIVSIIMVVRLLNLPWFHFGLEIRFWRPKMLVILSGLPLSLFGFLILKPRPLTDNFSWYNLVIGSAVMVIFVGFVEEIIFRGLLQQVANELFGSKGLLYSSLLFMIMYTGSRSLEYMLFMGLVGLFFGWCIIRSASILDVTLAHGLMNIGLVLVWPFLDRRIMAQISVMMQLVLWVCVAISLGLIILKLGQQLGHLVLVLIKNVRRP
jgi:uncharacterized protein